ncbi:MAG: Uma2 family endonuclease [Bacteroidetes bacterium]|nr:MAG: Uma2 family endonuclease [Bacteroidota bacterium]
MPSSTLLHQILQHPNVHFLLREINENLEFEAIKRRQFREMITEQQKAEFINGEVLLHSPVMKRHSDASGFLYALLLHYAVQKKLGYVGHEKLMIALSRNDYEPDVCFWKQERASQFTEEQMLFPAPDFVAEVLSKSTEKNDREVKFVDYAAHGVQEYWMVDPRKMRIERYRNEEGVFVEAGVFELDERIESLVVSGFSVAVEAIFEPTAYSAALQNLLK